MKATCFKRGIVSLLTLAAAIPWTAHGKALLLDFGPTVTQAAYATNSPAHFTGAVLPSEISWNTTSADSSSLVYSDGSAATGVSVDIGRSTAGSDTITFSDNGFTVNALGSAVNGGVYAGTSPVRDGIFGGSGGVNNLALGIRVDGLPSGTYTVYVHGRNANTALPAPLMFYATNGPSAGTYNFSTNDVAAFLANTSPAITNGFVEGNNFGVLTVTLGAGDSLYIASEGTLAAELRGFMNAIGIYFGVPQVPARITGQPTGKSVYEGVTVSLSAGVSGSRPMTNQWHFKGTRLVDGPSVSGATSNVLTLTRVTTAMAGEYNVAVTNALGAEVSSNATLTVVPVLNTEQMANIWNLEPGVPFLGTGSTERSIAYNPVTTNLLVVSRLPADPAIAVLDAKTGAFKHYMDMTGIPVTVPNQSLGLNVAGVADDGLVWAAGVTANAGTISLRIWGWPDDSSSNVPSMVFVGDPAAGVEPNLRWGDNIAVRGAGPSTQILMAPATGTNVVLLRTTSGYEFQNEIPPAVIAVSGVGSGFARFSLAFGSGTNTFWAKTTGGLLYLIEFDLTTGKGAPIQTYSSAIFPSAIRAVGVDKTQKFLAGVIGETLGENVRLYDISDLAKGPIMRDQETFETQNAVATGTASIAFGGGMMFALDENNGIKAFVINTNYVPPSITITAQPVDRSAMEGAMVSFSASVAGIDPMTLRWRFNGTNNLSDGPNVIGSQSNVLTLKNITIASAGTYSLYVSNAFGTAVSSNGVLTVFPTFNTAQMTNIWNLLPGDQPYVGTNSTERGLAYNAVTTNLLLVSRASADPDVIVLDALTGVEKRKLDTSGIPTTVPGTSLGLNTIGVAGDGAVYGASVSVNATTTGFSVYRWPNDAGGTPPTVAFTGDPASAVEPGLRWTDVMAVRGSGPSTQILLAPGSGTNIAVLRSTGGVDFQNEVPPAIVAISGVPSGFARLGLAFGPGENTFWAKSPNSSLYLVQFDLTSNTGFVVHEYTTNAISASLRGISVDPSQKYLAGIALDLNHNVQMYDIADLTAGPLLRDQEVFATVNANITSGGTGVTAFGGNYLFALDSNNGLKAFLVDTNYVAPVTEFSVTGVSQQGDSIVLSWESAIGKQYQVQSRDALSVGSWANSGNPIVATGTTTSATNTISGAVRFFRVVTQ